MRITIDKDFGQISAIELTASGQDARDVFDAIMPQTDKHEVTVPRSFIKAALELFVEANPNKKIQAIKWVRENLDLGLCESKELVEELIPDYNRNAYYQNA